MLLPLRSGQAVTYRPYVCSWQQLGEAVTVAPDRLVIVEGSYACHPALREHYDLCIFLTIEPKEQLRRIETRGGAAKAQQFRDRWIPLEERYFQASDVQSHCDMYVSG